MGPGRGSARVYVDGRLVTTVSLHATDAATRWIAWSRTLATPGTHAIRVKVVGTAGHPQVVVDGFVILR